MTREEAIDIIKKYDVNGCGYCHQGGNEVEEAFNMAIKALEQQSMPTMVYPQVEGITPVVVEPIPKLPPVNPQPCEDAISREDVINLKWQGEASEEFLEGYASAIEDARVLSPVKPQEPKTGQYEKHIDHTDCIWYGSDGGCPVTCSQYRDGWNDAMDYIFKNGKGYQPYRCDG